MRGRPLLGAEELKRTFVEFASYGTRSAAADMDGSKFVKLLRDSRLMSRGFTSTDADLLFSRVRRTPFPGPPPLSTMSSQEATRGNLNCTRLVVFPHCSTTGNSEVSI